MQGGGRLLSTVSHQRLRLRYARHPMLAGPPIAFYFAIVLEPVTGVVAVRAQRCTSRRGRLAPADEPRAAQP
ncbi:hypothetical protein CNECB9_4140003 [Cupriavidus necator]|uniref:Uncharacterized protein n=1 Tax=Cupriavidus necator TaxID=106590 RepID=A0A1K0JS52_CUPNE|nr:hypothetical protein CNECB9_4140003 [Cupriavidus necator]